MLVLLVHHTFKGTVRWVLQVEGMDLQVDTIGRVLNERVLHLNGSGDVRHSYIVNPLARVRTGYESRELGTYALA